MPKIQNVPKWMQRDLLPPGTDPTAFFGVAPKKTVPSLPIPKVATPPVATAPVAPAVTAPAPAAVPVTPPAAPMAGTEAWFTQQFRTTTDPAAMAALRQLYKETRQPFNAATVAAAPAAPPVPTVPTSATRAAAAFATQQGDILQQLQQQMAAPVDPASSPIVQAMLSQAKGVIQQAQLAEMEELDRRGILNSTIAADRLAQISQQTMVQVLPQILESAYGIKQDDIRNLFNLAGVYGGLEQQAFTRQRGLEQEAFEREQVAQQQQVAEQERQLKQALDRVDMLGYADNIAAAVLGVPVGTQSSRAKEAAANRANDLNVQRQRLQADAAERKFRADESEKDRKIQLEIANLRAADDEKMQAEAAQTAVNTTAGLYGIDQWTASVVVDLMQLPESARFPTLQAYLEARKQGTMKDDVPMLDEEFLLKKFGPPPAPATPAPPPTAPAPTRTNPAIPFIAPTQGVPQRGINW